MKIWIAIAAALALSACASTPKPLMGEYSAVKPMEVAKSSESSGEKVRWGGKIIQVEPLTDMTCFEILSRELSKSGRPRWADATTGRFIACRGGFYDPAVFTKDREITVVGQLSGVQLRKVGDYEYRFPTVNADAIYLWPERDDSYYGDPSFHLGLGYGFGFSRWGWSVPIIIHHGSRFPRSNAAQKQDPEAAPSQRIEDAPTTEPKTHEAEKDARH